MRDVEFKKNSNTYKFSCQVGNEENLSSMW